MNPTPSPGIHGASTGRREFLAGTLGVGLLGAVPALARPERAYIEVRANETGGTISPDNYGYLFEMGLSQTYDGVYVGEQAKIPHIRGFRRTLVEHMRAMGASLIRWPGGITADYYDWRDGIGPVSQRPRRVHWWQPPAASGGDRSLRIDPNRFGTDEFMALCRLTGGRPFLAVNVKTLPPNEFNRWIEYCNAPAGSTNLAALRAKNGSSEPYDVRYWSIGNEMWGIDGAMTAEEFVSTYKRYAMLTPRYGVERSYVAAGAPPGLSLEWVRVFMEAMAATFEAVPVGGLSIHYYAGLPVNRLPPGDTVAKLFRRNPAVSLLPAHGYDADGWYHMLSEYDALETLLDDHWTLMALTDPDHKIKLVVDEWGAILKTLSDREYPMSRPVTLRDALGAALTLDMFNRHCDKVVAACFNGLINHEGAIFQAKGEHFVATPVFDVFRMYAAHQGGTLVGTEFSAPGIGYLHEGRPKALWGLNGSASRKGRLLTLTVVNPHASEATEAEIRLPGVVLRSARLAELTHPDIQAYNSFETPQTVRATERAVAIEGSTLTHRFAPASVTRFSFEIA